MSLILGIHGFSDGSHRLLHDTGVALVQDGRVVFAVHEERLTRNKNEGAFPHRALALALERAPIPTIDAIAVADGRPGWQLREISRTAWRSWRSTGVAMPRYLADTLHRSLDWRRRMPRELAHLPVPSHRKCPPQAHLVPSWDTSPMCAASFKGVVREATPCR